MQRANEFMLTLSGGYHAGFNFGFNQAEGINIASTRWLQFYPDYLECFCSVRQTKFMKRVGKILSEIYQLEATKLQKEKFTCDICKVSVTQKRSLVRHMKTTHSIMLQRVECSKCEKNFARKEDLLSHFRNRHRNERIIIKKVMIKKEEKAKTGTSDRYDKWMVACNICDTVFHNRFSLRRHMERKHKSGHED